MPLWILNRRSVANLPKPTVLQREGKRLTRYWAVEKSEPLNQNVVFGRLMRQRKEQNCVLISNSVPIFWINFSLSFSLSGALSALNSFPLPPPTLVFTFLPTYGRHNQNLKSKLPLYHRPVWPHGHIISSIFGHFHQRKFAKVVSKFSPIICKLPKNSQRL